MKHRFLLHLMSHTFVVVDITKIRLSTDPEAIQQQAAPVIPLHSWRETEQYFLSRGADVEAVKNIGAKIIEDGVAVLTIV